MDLPRPNLAPRAPCERRRFDPTRAGVFGCTGHFPRRSQRCSPPRLPPLPHVEPSITVRQLLGHTSGVFDFVEHERSPFRVPYAAIDFAAVSSPEQVVVDLAGEPYFPPGQGWHYSTTNYLLLRMIAEEVSGAPVRRSKKA